MSTQRSAGMTEGRPRRRPKPPLFFIAAARTTGTSARARVLIPAISSSSVDTTTRAARPLCSAASMLQATIGLPWSCLTFLRGSPFEAPRAGIRARIDTGESIQDRLSFACMKDWKKALVSRVSTLRDTIEHIDAGAVQIALVVDEAGRLLGTVTDGDVRRALLRGQALDSPVTAAMNAKPLVARAGQE